MGGKKQTVKKSRRNREITHFFFFFFFCRSLSFRSLFTSSSTNSVECMHNRYRLHNRVHVSNDSSSSISAPMLAYMDDLLICKLITSIAAIPVCPPTPTFSHVTRYDTPDAPPCQFVSSRSNRFAALSTRCLPPIYLLLARPSLGRDSVLGIRVQTGRERKRRGEERKSNRLLIDPPRIPGYGFEYTLDVRRASVL